ncbi:hypothetical protein OG241_15715 [Streptomyces sp. NBC_01390]|uniref:hypothetical protein n=1 Tax=Streptomyces sp. NBC_01390 TaxID=2903850 RepID=UPI003243BC7B
MDAGTESPDAAATGTVESTPDTAGVVGEPAVAGLSPDGAVTRPTGTGVDLAVAADLCTAAVSVAGPGARGVNWTDAAPGPEEAAVGRTGGVADSVEPTEAASTSTEEEGEGEGEGEAEAVGEVKEARDCADASDASAGAPGTTPAATGATADGTPGATVPPAPPELPGCAAADFLATGKVRRCTTAAPETLVSGTPPATGEATAAAEPPALAVPPEATGATPEAEPEPGPGPGADEDAPPTATTRGPAGRATAPGNATR